MFFLYYLLITSFSFLSQKETAENFSQIGFIFYDAPNIYQFVLPAGRYKVSCFGSQGGWSWASGIFGNYGGKGAYAAGYINVTGHNTEFFATVGSMGQSSHNGYSKGGDNGGGISGWCRKWKHGIHHKQNSNGPGGGGGATDLRINSYDLSNRIIVAAGGSGAVYNVPGAPGGELTGYNAFGPSPNTNQVSGYIPGQGSNGNNAKYFPSSGAGGGYIGGFGALGSDLNPLFAVSDSGSSYISGFEGCAINPQMTLDSGVMKAGYREGNGYFQIDQVYQCPYNCISCSGPNQCKICDAEYRLYDGLCYYECPIGSIDRISYCEKCDPSCKHCSEIISNCTECFDNYPLYKGQCLDACPNGTFEYNGECKDECPSGTFPNGSICSDCNIECKECENISIQCTDCPNGKYLFNNECVDKCPERTVREGNKCLSECSANQFLYRDICYSQCPKGTFAKGIICELCHSSCAECQGDAITCTKCNENLHLLNSRCSESCPNELFSYKNDCVEKCPDNVILNGNECVDFCPKGKFKDNNKCSECDKSCASCDGSSTTCTSCNQNTYLYNYQCIDKCPNETLIYHNECITDCPSGSYLFNNICKDPLEYYSNEDDVHIRQPKASNTITGIVLPILIVLFIGGIATLVLLFIGKICNFI